METKTRLPVIFMSGPPRSGKDTVADYLVKLGYTKVTFAKHLKDATHYMLFGYEIDQDQKDYIELHKDERIGGFYGFTPRELYILFAEKFLKAYLSKTMFSEIVSRKINVILSDVSVSSDEFPSGIVVSDLGFTEEVPAFIQSIIPAVPSSIELVPVIIRTYREGTNFSKDSRSYVSNTEWDVINQDGSYRHIYAHNIKLDNNGDLALLYDKVHKILDFIN